MTAAGARQQDWAAGLEMHAAAPNAVDRLKHVFGQQQQCKPTNVATTSASADSSGVSVGVGAHPSSDSGITSTHTLSSGVSWDMSEEASSLTNSSPSSTPPLVKATHEPSAAHAHAPVREDGRGGGGGGRYEGRGASGRRRDGDVLKRGGVGENGDQRVRGEELGNVGGWSSGKKLKESADKADGLEMSSPQLLGRAERRAKAPRDLTCPISHKLMRDPVVAQDGFTYEKAEIEKWFEHSRQKIAAQSSGDATGASQNQRQGQSPSERGVMSPMTGERISSTLSPNHMARSLIAKFQDKQRRAKTSDQ